MTATRQPASGSDLIFQGRQFTAPNKVVWLAAPLLLEQSWLAHGFSTRLGGVSSAYSSDGQPSELNLGFTAADTQDNVRENRRRFAGAITGNRETPLATVRQIHSGRSVIADPANPEEADGIITDRPGFLLAIQTADCVPVLVADPVTRAVAAFHAGWRGTAQRIVESGIAQMRVEFGSRPQDLIAAIGPCIGRCCYVVGEELRSDFHARFEYAAELFTVSELPSGEPALRLDLVEANRRQLLAAGLVPGSIDTVGGCTSCRLELFYSHRATQGHAGRMMSAIGIV